MKKLVCVISVLTVMLSFAACRIKEGAKGNDRPGASADSQNTPGGEIPKESEQIELTGEKDMKIKIETEFGDMVAELYPEIAPLTVANFVKLAKEGFYNGLTFHRIISGFMIQGGCPEGTGTGGPGHSIKGEFSANGIENNLKHSRGVLSMARSQSPNSAGSQFFIMHADSPHLDGQYAAFGKLTDGFDVLDKIAETRVTDRNGSVPKSSQPKILTITIVE